MEVSCSKDSAEVGKSKIFPVGLHGEVPNHESVNSNHNLSSILKKVKSKKDNKRTATRGSRHSDQIILIHPYQAINEFVEGRRRATYVGQCAFFTIINIRDRGLALRYEVVILNVV